MNRLRFGILGVAKINDRLIPAFKKSRLAELRAIASRLPGVAQVQFLRTRQVSLSPERPNVVVIARDIDARDPGRLLFLVGPQAPVPAGARPAWVSEALLDLSRPNMDFAKIAEGFGVPATVATTCEELAEQFSAALAEPGPHLIDARIPALI